MTWSALPMELILDPKAPRASIRVLGYLSWRQGLHEKSWPSVQTMAAELGISERTVQRVIAYLIDKEYLKRTVPMGQGRGATCEYIVTMEKGDKSDSLSAKKDDSRVTLFARKGDRRVAERVTTVSHKEGGIKKEELPKRTTCALRLEKGVTHVLLLAGFDRFWAAYPRRVKKERALKIWMKIRPNQGLVREILAAIEVQRRSVQWLKNDGEFIPHPATWLNDKQWMDELPKAAHANGKPEGVALDSRGLTPVEAVQLQQGRLSEGEALAIGRRRLAELGTREAVTA